MQSKSGTISSLLSNDWKYIFKSCSCQGNGQYELYRRGSDALKYYIKQNKYSINNEAKRDIQEAQTDTRFKSGV